MFWSLAIATVVAFGVVALAVAVLTGVVSVVWPGRWTLVFGVLLVVAGVVIRLGADRMNPGSCPEQVSCDVQIVLRWLADVCWLVGGGTLVAAIAAWDHRPQPPQ